MSDTAIESGPNDTLALFESDRPKFTPDDLCRLTGWSKPTFWRHIKVLPHSRVGRFVRFSEKQLRSILASFEKAA